MRNIFILAIILGVVSCTNAKEIKVYSDSFGKEWPLLVNSGILSCENGNRVVFKVDDKKYAVNGAAQNMYPSILTISKDDKELGANLKKSSSVLIEKGLKLCN